MRYIESGRANLLSSLSQPPFYSRDTHEMYDNILHKPLLMRPGASNTAWSLLQALLEKDGAKRLGSRDDFVSGCLFFWVSVSVTGSRTVLYLFPGSTIQDKIVILSF